MNLPTDRLMFMIEDKMSETKTNACAYARVFARLFHERRDIVEGLERESHAGAADEILDRLRVRVGRDAARGRAT